MNDPASKQSRKRMFISILLAVVLHGLVFVAVQYGIRADQEEPEELIGPIVVTLYEPGQSSAAAAAAEPEKDRGAVSGPAEERAPARKERRLFEGREEREESARREEESQPRVSAKAPDSGHPEIDEREPTPRVERRDTGDAVSEELYQRGGILEQWEQEASDEIGRESELVESDQPFVIDREYEAEEDVRETGPVFPAKSTETEEELALDMDRLDEALDESREGAAGGGREGGTGSRSDLSRDQDETGTRRGTPNIVWDDSSRGRTLLSSGGLPDIPEWVKREGLDLKVEVAFAVTPEGHTKSLVVSLSSGYPDVDAAVLESVRKLRFNPIQDDREARGRINYLISTK